MDFQIAQVITHIIAFLLTVFLLKKYAWGPLIGMLEKRREKISGELEQIANDRRAAEELKREYDTMLKQVDAQARARIQEAVHDGERIAAEIKDKARGEARAMIEKGKDELVLARKTAEKTLQEDMVNMALAAAEKVVNERLDQEKHKELVRNFIAEVEGA